MKLRVGLIAPPFESVPPRLYGGTERVVHALACGLHSKNIETVVFASGDSTVPGRLIAMTPEALRLKSPKVQDAGPYLIDGLRQVARYTEEVDLLHNHNDYWMLPLSLMTSKPLLTTLHGRLDLPDLAEVLQSEQNSHFVSISDDQRNPLPKLKWIKTIRHGLDLRRFRFNPKPGSYLAFLGRISPEKRPDLAIKMAQDSGVPLKIAAKLDPGRDTDYFNERVFPHIDGRNIEFIGEISEHEKSQFLSEALALAFPIDWPEPFGLVMIEAMACGTPVIARPLGSVPEVIRDGVTGLLAESPRQLTQSLQDISKISRYACRAHVEQHFSIDRMVSDYIEVYQTLLGRA